MYSFITIHVHLSCRSQEMRRCVLCHSERVNEDNADNATFCEVGPFTKENFVDCEVDCYAVARFTYNVDNGVYKVSYL